MLQLKFLLKFSLLLFVAVLLNASAWSVTWSASVWGKRRAFTEHVEKLAELVEQKSGGKFTIKVSYGGLSKPRENLDGISIGAFELAQFCVFYHAEKTPTLTVTELPFARNVSLARTAAIFDSVNKHPLVVKDLQKWNTILLMPTPLPQYNIVSKSAPLTKIGDFKGMRVRGPGGLMAVLSKLGAVKTNVPFSEVRQAMDSGVIDAATFAPHAHIATKTFASAQWASTNLNLGTANCPVAMNADAYNDLSAEHKKILDESAKEALDYYVNFYESNVSSVYQKALKDNKVQEITFNAQQVTRIRFIAGQVRKDWVTQYADTFKSQELFDFTNKQFFQ